MHLCSPITQSRCGQPSGCALHCAILNKQHASGCAILKLTANRNLKLVQCLYKVPCLGGLIVLINRNFLLCACCFFTQPRT